MTPKTRLSCNSAGTGAGNSPPEKFPAGLRVLVVDDDPTCLMIISKMLKKCNYEAIVCSRADIGLSLLRENKNGCDIVLSDVHMPDMDGFKLLEHIGLEMDLPVIMMSADDSNSVVMKGVTHGACDYIIKPVRLEALRNIWQHVVRKQKHKWKGVEALTNADGVGHHKKLAEDVDHTSSANEHHNWKNAKRRKDEEDESEERDESSSSKKRRVIWNADLHQQFLAAVHQLGFDKAVPKKILELMNVPGLTRENVASHLQKYRLCLKRLWESQHPGSVGTSSVGTLEPAYGLRASTVNGQPPGQSLTSFLVHSNNSRSSVPVPAIDQSNTFGFEDPRFRSPEVTTTNFLHGIPTNMEPLQFMNLHQPHHHSCVNSQLLIPMSSQGQGQGQSQSRPVFPNVSGSGIVPSYNILNDSSQTRPDSGSQNMTFNDWLSSSSRENTGPTISFAVDDESGTHRNRIRNNQDDQLTVFLHQPREGSGQQENEFRFDGYALDDLPRAT